ncbi:hypothetical protein Esti_001411 [Eimeria stiedai]
MAAAHCLKPAQAEGAHSADPGGSRLLNALDRMHNKPGSSPIDRRAFVTCVDVWLTEALAVAADTPKASASDQAQALVGQALKALASDQRKWRVLLHETQGGPRGEALTEEAPAPPLHPRLVYGCLFALESLLLSPAVCGASSLVPAAACAAVETLRLLPAARSFCESKKGPLGRSRVKHLGRKRRKGMEQQDVDAAKQQKERLSAAAANLSMPPPVIAGYADAEETAAVHSAAVSLIVRLLVESTGSRDRSCQARDSNGSAWLSSELQLRLKEVALERQGMISSPEEAGLRRSPLDCGEPLPWGTPISLKGVSFASLAALASSLCSRTNDHLQDAVASFALALMPLLLDLLTVETLQPLAAPARTQLLPSVLRRVSHGSAAAFLFAAMHRLLSRAASGSTSAATESPFCRNDSRPSLSLQVFSVLQQGPPPPRCAEAFDLAVRHPDVFLSNESPPPTLEEAENLLMIRCVHAVETTQRQLQEAEGDACDREASGPAWGPQDVRWRWLFWGLTCPVIGCVRSSARQLLQQLQQQQQQQRHQDEVPAAKHGKAWAIMMQLLEALDDFSQHLIKQQLQIVKKLCALVAAAAERRPRSDDAIWPLEVQPLWVETVLLRAFAHDNAMLSRSFLLSFMSLCSEGTAADVGEKRSPPLLLCLTTSFVLEAMIPHMGIPSFFCRGSDCRQAEMIVQCFLQRKIALDTQQHEGQGGETCVSRYLQAVGDHCHTYTPLRVFLDALLSPGEGNSALQEQPQPAQEQIQQHQQAHQHQQQHVFFKAVAQLMTVIATTPHSIRGSLHERLLRVVALHAPAGCLSLPVLGSLLVALPPTVFAAQIREAAAASTDSMSAHRPCCTSGKEAQKPQGTPALLELLHSAFPSNRDFVAAVQRQLQLSAQCCNRADEAEGEEPQQQHAALVLVRLLAAAAVECDHDLCQELANYIFSQDISERKRLMFMAAAVSDKLPLSLASTHQQMSAALLVHDMCASLHKRLVGLARGLLNYQHSGSNSDILYWPTEGGSYDSFWADIQQWVLSLRLLSSCISSEQFAEALSSLSESALDKVLVDHPQEGDVHHDAPAALLKAAVAALAQWGLAAETQTTGAIIGALTGGANADEQMRHEGSIVGLWLCANIVLGSSVNRKTLSALKHASLPRAKLEEKPETTFEDYAHASHFALFRPDVFPLPEGLRQSGSWLEVVEWFYSSKGDALASLLTSPHLMENAKGNAVCVSAAGTVKLPLPLLPSCTPAGAVAGYNARVLGCQKTYAGLFVSQDIEAGRTVQESPAEAAGAAAGPIGMALLLLQEVGESHLKETPGLLGAVASFALPVLVERLLVCAQDGSESSSSLAKATAEALASFVADCRRLIQERLETSIPPNLIGRLCCVVLHPLMIQAEWRVTRVLSSQVEGAGSEEEGLGSESARGTDLRFAFNFARDLLAEGSKSLALSRAIVLPLLSSLFFAGGTEAQKKTEGFSLSADYVRLLGDVLLHREFVLPDGIGCVPTEPFDEAENFPLECTDAVDRSMSSSTSGGCSRWGQLRGLSELDPAAFFLSKCPPCRGPCDLPYGDSQHSSASFNCFRPSLSLLPRFFSRRFGRLQQTPAYVRLLTLALFDSVCLSLAVKGRERTLHEAFLANTASAIFRHLAERAIASVSAPICETEEQNEDSQGDSTARVSAEAHLPMPNSAKHRLQLRAWQSLSCLSIHAHVFDPAASECLVDGVWTVLNSPLMADVRHYVEFVAVRLALKNPTRCIPRIKETLSRFNVPRQVLISGLCIAGYTLLNLRRFVSADDEKATTQLERQLLFSITPYLTSNAAYCRGIAQFLLHEFLAVKSSSHLNSAKEHDEDGGIDSTNPLPLLLSMLNEAKECRMMIAKVAAAFRRWRPDTDGGLCSLIPESGIVEETLEQHDAALMGLTVVGVKEKEDQAEQRFADVLSDFDLRPSWALAVALKDVVKDEMKRAWHMDEKGGEERAGRLSYINATTAEDETNAASNTQGEETTGRCQRKFVPQQHDKESPGACPLSTDDAACFNALRQRSHLIVIASLVNKAPNLGGLARTCEVFNTRQVALVVSNMDLLKDPSFRNTSVSADQWLPMVEVEPDALPAYFATLRREGYAIVGLEQTAFSRVLGDFSFPRKTALVLGAEKEGLPAPLMAHIDDCVEIPQASRSPTHFY